MIQLLLSDAGFHVTAAEKAAELLLLVNTERFDAFLPDNRMPEISGDDLIRALHNAFEQQLAGEV